MYVVEASAFSERAKMSTNRIALWFLTLLSFEFVDDVERGDAGDVDYMLEIRIDHLVWRERERERERERGAALGYEPDFIYPLENVTIAQGRDATFTCVVNNLGGYRVSGSGADPSAAHARVCTRFYLLSRRTLSLSLSVSFFFAPLSAGSGRPHKIAKPIGF
ncbi:hypothetical protein B566_EDAN002902 [Ephemera danica]|nr:hypothetical protein B566_EDAN002902 [Ephemera danica]